MKSIGIIKSLINLVGSSVGVIMIAIGAVMIINSVLKLYVFDLEGERFINDYRCDYLTDNAEFHNAKSAAVAEESITKEERKAEYDACIEREAVRGKEQFILQKKHSMIDGFASFIVGLPILWFYSRRSKFNKSEEK